MPRKPPYHHGDLRRAILDATLAWVDEAGAGTVSLREIARRAGVSHGAPYHHFGDRSGVFAAIAEEGYRMLTEAMRAAADAAAGPREAFEACGRAYVEFAVCFKGHFRIMFRPELADPQLYRR